MTLSSQKYPWAFTFCSNVLLTVMLGLFVSGCADRNQVQIPSLSEFDKDTQQININNAGAFELTALEGIGPKTAARIIGHRDEFGKFRNPADIMLVEGIGEKLFLKIRHKIRTD